MSLRQSITVTCPLCGAELRRLLASGHLGKHRDARTNTSQCPAGGWAPSYVEDLITRDDVADVAAALRFDHA